MLRPVPSQPLRQAYPKSRMSKSGCCTYLYTPHLFRSLPEYVSISILIVSICPPIRKQAPAIAADARPHYSAFSSCSLFFRSLRSWSLLPIQTTNVDMIVTILIVVQVMSTCKYTVWSILFPPRFFDCHRRQHTTAGFCFQLGQEVVINLCREIILSPALSAKRLAVTNLLQIVQPASDPAVPVAVESVEVDGRPAVHTGINLRTVKDRLAVSVHDSRRRAAVGVDKIRIRIRLIIRSFRIAVTERSLQYGKSRYGLAAALKLSLAFLIRRR